MTDRRYGGESVTLQLPAGVGLECLGEEWRIETGRQESRHLVFLDTFEWGLWFGGYHLFRCGGVYHLGVRERGGLGGEVCHEAGPGRRRFWQEFATPAMREKLEGLLGLRGLATVAEGTFRSRRIDLRNDTGKIVCRMEWLTVTPGKNQDQVLLHACLVLPLLGYEPEADRVRERLLAAGATAPDHDPLDALLRHAGREPREYTLRPAFGLTPELPAREAVGRIIRPILAIAAENVPGILDDLDTEFLHDYRICLRKVRSLLSLLPEVYPVEETRRIRTLLGDLARETNRLRDLDVYLLERDTYQGLLPPGFRPALEGMFADYAAERNMEVLRVISKLREPSRQGQLREVTDYFADNAPHEASPAAGLAIGPLAFRRIYQRYRKIRRIARELGAHTTDAEVHRLRIEGKKLRYLMEFFTELIPPAEGAALVKSLRRLQGRLGEFNDASLQQHSLLSYGEQHRTGYDVALGLGGLVAVLYQRQQQARNLIEQALAEFGSPATARTFKRLFKAPASDAAAEKPEPVPA